MRGAIWVETGELLETARCLFECRPFIKVSLQENLREGKKAGVSRKKEQMIL